MVKKEAISHILMPKHTILNESEKMNVLQKYNISIQQLPRIKSNDPALVGLDAKAGDVVKIERVSYTTGTSLFYRIVVDN